MKIVKPRTVVVATILSLLVVRADALSSEVPDLILSGGHVRVADGWAEGLAVRRGVIVAIGSSVDIRALAGAKTQRIELDGATVIPGLHDVHVHPTFAGIIERACKIAQGADLATLIGRVRSCSEAAPDGAWITGGQWDAPALGAVPDRRALDAVTGTHPAYIEDTSGHSVWVNSKALEIAGITRDTPNPVGGVIEHDAAGRPTGVLREDSALDLVRRHQPTPDRPALLSALSWSLREMLSHGITSYTEASVGFVGGSQPEIDVYDALADENLLKPRATLCIKWDPADLEAEKVIRNRNLYARERVKIDCVKIFLDGVPTDSHTAAMIKPYAELVAGRDDEASRRGLLFMAQPDLDAAVTRFDAMGLTVKFHAAGDGAVRAGLNAIEAARRANGYSGQMHDVGHCTFVAPEDILRARGIGATFEVSPYLWGPSPINDSITSAVGAARIERVWPVREMIDAGALVVPGSDWAVVPSVNPWHGIEQLVTRQKLGGSFTSFGPKEAISFGEALDLFTINAARQERTSDRLGRVAVGYLADLVVVRENPFEIPATQLHDVHVRMTLVGGEVVWKDAESSR
ncbi:MAG: amidohydrolase [Pseudomonadota bacterium]